MQIHDDQVHVDEALVRGLLDRQLPEYARLPLAPVAERGTDHLLYRLGDDLLVRMPVYAGSAEQAASDARWLPVLAPHLPVAVPVPVAVGRPDATYPFAWSVVPWLPGRNPTDDDIDPLVLVEDLAAFVRALHAIDTAGGPVATGTRRGAPVRSWDEAVRAAVDEAGARIDRDRVLAAWTDCLAAPDWDRDPVWVHGDLLRGNLIVETGRLSAVIDFGALGVGDPAVDLLPAWATLPAGVRAAYREATGYDDDTWRRGRGWALAPALTGIPYYWDTMPAFARHCLRVVDAVLEDLGAG